ncbi:hypothetical protein AC579_4793 [Pseudocercospora musae]|uniref:Deacetylase sirtuin-type domain-containing protein n=1 Tax=Pseudocercospora musae TaxID=113226 RepID=A0A139H7Z4_9PEZI|nr:hypothetical protein AC579_4793 [Pseudocercospora musae]
MPDRSSLGEYLANSRYILVLIGAGVSSPSGIPTYRGDSASGRDNADFATPAAFAQRPAELFEYYADRRSMAGAALPNSAHFALARLAREKEHFLAITQNIDGLSQRAGHSKSKLVELHGSLFGVRCTKPACDYVIADTTSMKDQEYRQLSKLNCPKCRLGILRPDVTWFGERLRQDCLDSIDRWLLSVPRVDLMLVVGTSCNVFPAAEYIHTARRKGAYVAHFNIARDDEWIEPGDWYVPGDVATTLPRIVSECCT